MLVILVTSFHSIVRRIVDLVYKRTSASGAELMYKLDLRGLSCFLCHESVNWMQHSGPLGISRVGPSFSRAAE